MKKLKMNSKGFTLIELLAVIVILGVLMIIAIPMVSQYITQSRKDAFIATAKAYVDSARYGYLNGDYTDTDPVCTTNCSCAVLDAGANTVYIKFRYIRVDKTGGKSSFNKTIDLDASYVKITSTNDGEYTYSVYMKDSGQNSFPETEEKNLSRDIVKTQKNGSFKSAQACKGTYDAKSSGT